MLRMGTSYHQGLHNNIEADGSVRLEEAERQRARAHLLTRNIFTGRYRLIESKFGPNADFHGSQAEVYSDIAYHQEATFTGGNAAAAGIPRGTTLTDIDINVDWWPNY